MKNIPKICHLYWDCTPMSYLNTRTVTSFHKQNPDWEIIIYLCPDRGGNLYTDDYTGRDYFYYIRSLDYVTLIEINLDDYNIPSDLPSHQISTMWRTQILYKHGGVYSDFDVYWIKPIEHLKSIQYIGNINDFDSVVCFYNMTDGFQNGSIWIAEKGSDYMKYLIDAQLKVRPPYEHQSFGTTLYNSLYKKLGDLRKDFPRVLAVPYKTFYPYSTFDLKPLFVDVDLGYIDDEVIGIHWFFANPVSIAYLNQEEENDCSIKRIISDL